MGAALAARLRLVGPDVATRQIIPLPGNSHVLDGHLLSCALRIGRGYRHEIKKH